MIKMPLFDFAEIFYGIPIALFCINISYYFFWFCRYWQN